MDEDFDFSSQFSSLAAAINQMRTRLMDLDSRITALELQVKTLPHQTRVGSLGYLNGTIDDHLEK